MVKLIVRKIEDTKYTLEREITNELYEFNLTFFDLKKDVEVGDVIGMNEELLNPNFEEYSKSYYFGPIDQAYGREVKNPDDIELIAIEQGAITTVLKRFFG